MTFTFALYIYTYVCIRCEKLAHVIMEADKSPDLQLAGWSSRKATGVVPRQRPTGLTSKKVTVSLEVQRQGKEMRKICWGWGRLSRDLRTEEGQLGP